ncbi:MAG: helix-turn-helix domain-containing protein [Actinomycetota bacterium]
MTPEDHDKIRDLVEAGESYTAIGRVIGRRLTTLRDYVYKHHGRRPLPPRPRSERRLSVEEREEISRGLALDESFRAIAARTVADQHPVELSGQAPGHRQGPRRPRRPPGPGCRR